MLPQPVPPLNVSVLLVDDESDVLNFLHFFLTSTMQGVTVDRADSGCAALERIAATDYDVVVSDIVMPGMNGLELLEKIRQVRPPTPVVLMTGFDERELIVRALRGGAYDFLLKPIDPDYFLATVSRAIQMRRLSRQVEEQKAAMARHATELERIVAERTQTLRDEITERKQVEAALAASETFLSTVIEVEPECVKLLARDGTVLMMNRAGLAMFEADTPEQVRGRCVYPIVAEEYRPAFQELAESVFRGEPGKLEFEIVGLKGARRWLDTKAVPLRDLNGAITAFLGVARDITDRKQAEEELRESGQQLRQLLEDRERIAQDLHDNVIQTIYAIGLGLEECRQLVKEGSTESAKSALGDAIVRLNGVIRDVRGYIAGQIPQISSGRQLKAAMGRLARTMETTHSLRFGVAVDEVAAEKLTPEEANNLFSIVHEAMSNSLRHSKARTALVSLRLRDGGVRLQVEDDGVGFDANTAVGRGQGLRNIETRAKELGARFEIVSQRGQGVRVILDIPLEREDV